MVRYLLLLSFAIVVFAGGYYAPDNRSQAKNILKMIHLDYKKSFVTGCAYDYDKSSCMDKTEVNTTGCHVKESNQSISWIQVVPDTFFGRNRACMKEKPCTNVFNKKAFGSPLCCRRIDEHYRAMEADLFNLVPVVSALANAQQGRIFFEVKKPIGNIGDVIIGVTYMEPPLERRGEIARIYLYMDAQYDLQLTQEQRALYMQWHQSDAVSEQECAMAKIITKIQGHHNRYIEAGCVSKK